jgi:hypothetical protein
MTVLRIIGGIVAFVLLGFLVFAWFLPSEFKSENTIYINEDRDKVYDHVINLDTWQSWQVLDTNITNTVHTRNGVRDSLIWTGLADISGSIVIDSTDKDRHIRFIYQYANQPDDFDYGYMYFEDKGEGTQVTWKHHNDVGWNPILRFALNYTNEWEVLFDRTLVSLKADIENSPNQGSKVDPSENIEIDTLSSISNDEYGTNQTLQIDE